MRSRLNGVERRGGRLAAATDAMDLQPELFRIAAPLLDELEESLAGTGWMVVLSDQGGRLTRLGGTRTPVRHRFESVGACAGAGAAEAQIGTNAIGTALEEGRPIIVVGDEHYQQGFERVSCAAATVRNPVTNRTVGALGVAALDATPGKEILALVSRAARELERTLLEHASATDRLVLEALKRRGRGTSRSVVGVTREIMIANDPGVRLLPRLDQASLWERARETVESGRDRWVSVPLGFDGASVRVRCTPVRHVDETVGALLDFGRVEPGEPRPSECPGPAHHPTPTELPSRSTTSPRLPVECPSQEAHALRDRILAAASGSAPVLVSGEPGSGKLTTALEVLAARFPTADPEIVSCSDPRAVARLIEESPSTPLVLTHIEHLDPRTGYRLRDHLRRSGPAGSTMVVTTNTPSHSPTGDNPLLDELAGTHVDVPGLRFRRDDIAPLAERFAAASGRPRRISTEAMQLFLRYPWPGNIRELSGVVRGACAASAVALDIEHLPSALRRLATRRPLSPLEQAEADAILAALRACNNNKVKAAELLQISRSRLYRKAGAYGLTGALLG